MILPDLRLSDPGRRRKYGCGKNILRESPSKAAEISRTKASLAPARAEGKTLGRPRVSGSKGHVGDLQQIRMLHKQSRGGSAGALRKLRRASLISGALSTTALGYCRSPKRCQLWLQQRQAKRRIPD